MRVNHPTNTTASMVALFDTTVAWRWQISPPHPQESLRKELVEGVVLGFYLTWLMAD
jgi:hypothetical protein